MLTGEDLSTDKLWVTKMSAYYVVLHEFRRYIHGYVDALGRLGKTFGLLSLVSGLYCGPCFLAWCLASFQAIYFQALRYEKVVIYFHVEFFCFGGVGSGDLGICILACLCMCLFRQFTFDLTFSLDVIWKKVKLGDHDWIADVELEVGYFPLPSSSTELYF